MKRKSLKFQNQLPLLPMSNISKQKLICPLYHTLKQESNYDFISPLYQARSLKQFEEDLDYFLKNFKPISLNELIQITKTGEKIKEPCFHLSFDDGLSTFYHQAAPILKKKGIPATCFLNNDFIDNKGLFFRYKVALLITALEEKDKLNILLKETGQGDKKEIINFLKTLKHTDTKRINELLCLISFDLDGFLQKEKPYMDEDQVKDLIVQGFTFGGHSSRHFNYELLSQEEQLKESIESVEDIKARFELDYSAFAFPFTDHGVGAGFFNQAEEKLDISFGTGGMKNREYGFHYHRIIMEDNILSAEKILKAEYLYYILKAPFGKNSIYRK